MPLDLKTLGRIAAEKSTKEQREKDLKHFREYHRICTECGGDLLCIPGFLRGNTLKCGKCGNSWSYETISYSKGH